MGSELAKPQAKAAAKGTRMLSEMDCQRVSVRAMQQAMVSVKELAKALQPLVLA